MATGLDRPWLLSLALFNGPVNGSRDLCFGFFSVRLHLLFVDPDFYFRLFAADVPVG